LELALEVFNPSNQTVTFEEALHTYLAVADIHAVKVLGLAGTTYIDKTDGMKRKAQGPEPLRIKAETDRVYLGTQATCVVEDPVWGRRLIVEKQGSDITVVWNPWIERAKAMSDFGDDEWPAMLCIESANAVDFPVELPPQKRRLLRAVIRSEPC
jgi:glucose-6-phosphate 1-epimerase